jgi:hypothetical protein
MQRECKYKNRGRGVLYVLRMSPFLGNRCVCYGSLRGYVSNTEPNEMRMGIAEIQRNKKDLACEKKTLCVL